MKKIKVLNLYAGIGGNRKLWKNVEVTAIENNESIAKIYQDFFPDDKVIIGDAKEYLLKHYKEFDFIWASPPCPTHSRIRLMATKSGSYEAKYPEMDLYQIIIFLKHYFDGKWIVENVISFYEPLIKPFKLNRHYFWSNFKITFIKTKYGGDIRKGHARELQEIKGINIDKYKLKGRIKDSAIRSYFDPEIALHIFNCAFKEKQLELKEKEK